jgi:ATP-binding cassette subfamily C protein CydC
MTSTRPDATDAATRQDRTRPDRARQDHGALRRITAMLEIPRGRLLAAIGAACTTLAAAFALAAVSGWLITTAWTRPPVLDLTVAVVAVRALGVSRAAFRWLDRMLTHDVALRGVVSLRTNLFTALARRPADALSRLRRGDLLTRIGDDAQEMGDHVIRAVVPAAVAVVMGIVVLVAIAPISLPAAGAMLAALLVAGVLSPLAAGRAARISETAVVGSRAELGAQALEILDDADALRVQGRLDQRLDQLRSAQRGHDRALDAAALPSALAAAAVPLSMMLAVLGSVLAAGGAWQAGAVSAGQVGILFLVPLSSFEAATALPAAASQHARSRAAAERLDATVSAARASAGPTHPSGVPSEPGDLTEVPTLRASSLGVGWSADAVRISGLDLQVSPGQRVAVVGPSGSGKSTLLLTLAGLLDQVAGRITLDGHELTDLDTDLLRSRMIMQAEDAHVFATTVRENLKVARGDLEDTALHTALEAVDLEEWVAGLPHGLDTMLGPDGTTVSGGERRRLLLARSVLRRAPITLLDEPTEHLDVARGDLLLRHLLDPQDHTLVPEGATVLVVTHRIEAIPTGTRVLRVDPTTARVHQEAS